MPKGLVTVVLVVVVHGGHVCMPQCLLGSIVQKLRPPFGAVFLH